MQEGIGGMLDPGKPARGVRRAVLDSSIKAFEQSRMSDNKRTGTTVELTTPHGTVRADKMVLATDAWRRVGHHAQESLDAALRHCNGHGLCQVPYVGKPLADYVVDGELAEDLAGIWSNGSEHPLQWQRC